MPPIDSTDNANNNKKSTDNTNKSNAQQEVNNARANGDAATAAGTQATNKAAGAALADAGVIPRLSIDNNGSPAPGGDNNKHQSGKSEKQVGDALAGAAGELGKASGGKDKRTQERATSNLDGSTVFFDNQGRVDRVQYANGKSRQIGYDQQGHISYMSNPDGSMWERSSDGTYKQYNSDGQVTQTTADKLSVDQHGQVEAHMNHYGLFGIKIPADATLSYKTDGSTVSTDSQGRVYQVTYPNGQTRSFGRDNSGNINSVTETDGSTWKQEGDGKWHQYDTNDKSTGQTMDGAPSVTADGQYSFIKADGSATNVYNTDGSSAVHHADGSINKYDQNGMLSEMRYSDGSVRTFERDQQGNLQAITNPDGSAWVNNGGSWEHRDSKGNVMESAGYAPRVFNDGSFSVAEADGTVSTFKPDGSSEAKRGDGSTVEANAHGDVTSVTCANGSKRAFSYDANHNLTGFTDASGAWKFENGQWTKPDGSTTDAKVAVDPNGNLTITNSDGTAQKDLTNGAQLTTDNTGKVTHIRYPNGQQRDIPQGAQVDANGNYTVKNSDGTSERYNSDGSTVHTNTKGQIDEVDYASGEKRQFKYNDKGTLVAMEDSNGTLIAQDSKGNWKQFNKNNPFDIKDANPIIQVFPDGTIRGWDGGDILTSTANVTAHPEPGHNLWGVHSDNPLAAITPNAVHQGDLGDCYFLSALASQAQENPQMVKNMIRDNGNGTYTVTFPGDPSHPVTVDAPTEHELGTYAQDDGQNGMWVNVIEKAHRKYTGRETSDGGDSTDAGLKLLTPPGQHVHIDHFTSWSTNGSLAPWDWSIGSTSDSDTEKHIEQALANHEGIVASTADGSWLNHLGTTNDPGKLVTDHDWAVVGYDPKTKTVTLRNPWGGNGGDNGTFTLSLHDFTNDFTEMAYESNS